MPCTAMDLDSMSWCCVEDRSKGEIGRAGCRGRVEVPGLRIGLKSAGFEMAEIIP
jgi:hypothetical protein